MEKVLKKPLIIAGFAGVGKTTLAKKYENVIDLESSLFKWDNTGLENIPIEQRKGTKRKENPKWPYNYIDEIEKQSRNYDIILVWIAPRALELYDENKIEYILCYPEKSAIGLYEKRYRERGNNEDYIEKVVSTYDERFEEFKQKNVPQIILQGEETLEDYLIRNEYILLERI